MLPQGNGGMAGGQQSLPETLETPPGRRAPRRHDCGAVAVLRRGRAPNGRHASRLGRQRPRAPNGRRGRAPPGGLVTSAASARLRCMARGGPAQRRSPPRSAAPAAPGASVPGTAPLLAGEPDGGPTGLRQRCPAAGSRRRGGPGPDSQPGKWRRGAVTGQ